MKYFIHIDLHSSYWQIILDLMSGQKIAFSSRYDHYEFNVILFDLSNVLEVFQCRMNKILRRYLDQFCISYLDDILIYSKSKKEYTCHIKKIFKILNEV